MFEVGWTEMLVIAIVLIVVVGPKDLPRMLRTFGRMTTKLRGMAGDFQKQFNEALKEAELDDVKKSVDAIKGLNPTNEIRKHVNPFQKAADEIRAGVDAAMKPKPAEVKPAATVHAAEPLKNGATAMPGVEAPLAMPEPPLFPADDAAPAPVVTGPASTPAAAAASAPPVPSSAAAVPAAPATPSAPAAPAVAVAAPLVSRPAEAAAPIVASVAEPAPAAAKKRAARPKVAEAAGDAGAAVNGAKPKARAKPVKAPPEDAGEPVADKKPAGAGQ